MKIEIEIPDCNPLFGERDTALRINNLPPAMCGDEILQSLSAVAHLENIHLSESCEGVAYVNVATAAEGQRLLAATVVLEGRVLQISRSPLW
jgi:hypothetical protein